MNLMNDEDARLSGVGLYRIHVRALSAFSQPRIVLYMYNAYTMYDHHEGRSEIILIFTVRAAPDQRYVHRIYINTYIIIAASRERKGELKGVGEQKGGVYMWRVPWTNRERQKETVKPLKDASKGEKNMWCVRGGHGAWQRGIGLAGMEV